MTKVGTFTYYWRETRYLPLVLEQLDRAKVTSIVYRCAYPLYWNGVASPEPGANYTVNHTNDPHGTECLINTCLSELEAAGCDVALWIDSDFLFTLNDFDRLVDHISASPPSWWRVEANHYWRSFNTTYATTGFRIGVPTSQRWEGRFGFRHEPDDKPTVPNVLCHHPSWVLEPDEVRRKVNSWFHAPEFAKMDWPAKWFDGRADSEQVNLKVAEPLPDELVARLTKAGAL